MNIIDKLKKKRTVTPSSSTSAVGASTSTSGGTAVDDSLTKEDALRNASTALEALKSVGDAAGVLGPLKAVCGVLKIVVDTAVLLKNNGEDVQDLVDKLEQHQRFLEKEIKKLSEPEYSRSGNVQEITGPLQDYLSNLQKLYGQLKLLKTRYDETSKRKRFKAALKAQSDQGQITDCTQKLQDSFQQFMNAMISFISRQTLLLRNEMAVLHESMTEMSTRLAEKDANDALSRLAYADARGNQHETCMEGTREGLLEDIASWATNSTPIFALVDQAGTGKSTVAKHMTQQWEKDGLLLARYHFSKPSTVTGKDLASTVAKDMARSMPALRPLILRAIEEHPDFTAYNIREQLERIVFEPLKSLEPTRILVIDALDECSKEDRAVFLELLLDFIASYPTGSCPLKLLLTCRPEEDLVSRLREPRYTNYIDEVNFQLRPEQHPSNEADIRLYAIALLSNFLTEEQIDEFVLGARGLFIWASTAYNYLKDALDPSARFKRLMKKGKTLEALYGEIISGALKRVGDQDRILVKVLQAICVAREPLTIDMMDKLLVLQNGIAGRVVTMLSSVLSDGNQGKPVHVLHPTFLEYLLDPKACQLGISREEAEALVARGCLSVCLNGLKYDICEIHHPPQYPPIKKDIKNLGVLLRERTTPALRYAAINALSHVGSSLHDQRVIDRLRDFFNSKLLNWIELMSLYGKIYSLMQSVQQLKTRIEEKLEPSTTILTSDDLDWCSQIRSMVQAFQGVIEESAMQVYFSALPFEPPTSQIARCYLPQFAQSIPRVIRGSRNPHSQSMVLCGHTGAVTCIAYALDGYIIASGSKDGTVRLWDSLTGARVMELTDHAEPVDRLMFSPNGKILASTSSDNAVRLWDTSSGAAFAELTGHTKPVKSLVFLPDNKTLASTSFDNTIRLWDGSTGTALAELTGDIESVKHLGRAFSYYTVRHQGVSKSSALAESTGQTKLVDCFVFSPDGKTLAWTSYDNKVRLQDASTGAALAELTGHIKRVNCLVFSPDGKTLASMSFDNTIRLWDGSTGAALSELTGHTKPIYYLIFSPDGKIIASTSSDNTVRLWDASTGAALAESTGRTEPVIRLVFSPDSKIFAWTSYDNTIRVWDASTGAALAELTGHTDMVNRVALSPDSKTLASTSSDNIVQLWDASTGAALAELTGHTGTVNCIALSPDSRTLAFGSYDNTIRLLDASTGAALVELTGHTKPVNRLVFSPDNKTLASISSDNAVRLWDKSSGAAFAELTGHTKPVNRLVFSPDGKILALTASDNAVRLWDASTGAAFAELTGHSKPVNRLVFSPDNKTLASTSSDNTVRLWDVSTGAALAELTDHTDVVYCLAFSPDGKTLASGSSDNTMRLWDLSIGAAPAELTGRTGMVNCLTFSPDGKMLASAFEDYTVQLWDLPTGAAFAKITGHTGRVNCFAFSPDGKMLASSDNQAVRLWDLSTGVAVQDPLWHESYVEHLNFHFQNGNLFLKAERRWGQKTLWNMSTNPPSRQSSERTPLLSPPLISPLVQFDRDSNRTRISTAGISFHLPPYFPYKVFCSHGGIAAYGGRDGSIIIVDCSHLV